MKKDIENFKNDILFMEIHNTEWSDKLWELLEIAEQFIRSNKEKRYERRVWQEVLEKPNILYVFKIIASQILLHEKLLILLDELEGKNYQTDWVVSFKYEYYKEFFEERIKNSKTILKKLRPYILVETKEYSLEQKKRDMNTDIGVFFNGWYLLAGDNEKASLWYITI